MKFSIGGRTFDTAAATKVAACRGINLPSHDMASDPDLRFEDVLYRTAKGAFFVHEHAAGKPVNGARPVVTDEARELSPDEAAAWIIDREAAVIDPTGLPEERSTPFS